MKDGKTITLGIETSCDETAAAIVADGRDLLSNIISSQIEIHTAYGGVVPEIASRKHLEDVNRCIKSALEEAKVTLDQVDLIGVTNGPGLIGALVIGVAAAKALSLATGKPLIGVNHMHGHVSSNYLTYSKLEPPFLSLIVSGGHTNIVYVRDYNDYEVLGGTRDDAIGEAYDKVARVIGLGYPGGPKIDGAARDGDPDAIKFKRVYLEKGSYDFSFSGIKTQVLNYVNSEIQGGREVNINDVAAGFQEACTEVVTEKIIEAAKNLKEKRIVVAGGVAANSRLREMLSGKCDALGIELFLPEKRLCTDNAAMIASAAYYEWKLGREDDLKLDAFANLDF